MCILDYIEKNSRPNHWFTLSLVIAVLSFINYYFIIISGLIILFVFFMGLRSLNKSFG